MEANDIFHMLKLKAYWFKMALSHMINPCHVHNGDTYPIQES